MANSSELAEAENWIRSRNGAIRRVPWADGGRCKVIVSAGGMSRQSNLQDEQPGEYDDVVVGLVLELKTALGDARLRPCR
jgi:hypothetical protein